MYDTRDVNYGRIVESEVCYNSLTQDGNSHGKIEGNFYIMQNLEWSDALVDKYDGNTYTYIPLLIRQMNDAKENLNCAIFDVPDMTAIFCKLQHAWNGHAPQQIEKL